jgi:hypothetical protein
MEVMTDDILSKGQQIFETLLKCLETERENVEFRVYPMERRGKKVPVLAFAIMDEEENTHRVIPLAELICDSTKEQKQIFAFPHGALYSTLKPGKEETCQKNSEPSPSSFLIKSSERKH